jgi:hypothetical protein
MLGDVVKLVFVVTAMLLLNIRLSLLAFTIIRFLSWQPWRFVKAFAAATGDARC